MLIAGFSSTALLCADLLYPFSKKDRAVLELDVLRKYVSTRSRAF
jgi:hypothetical protein